eukprot:CAMPEP_0174926660 /NCGR_PEP_ID=MMETSP1355-20121228/13249_1 /TAXON_ID=464990 /ORGANISM="Hemiselmis tepida, Strain CCMP443" /LENGTH=104 /DNA_ID=CAMNT_0016172713 /DNA_START=36 /DNA_END=350 /DNA_ORIENTATION=+
MQHPANKNDVPDHPKASPAPTSEEEVEERIEAIRHSIPNTMEGDSLLILHLGKERRRLRAQLPPRPPKLCSPLPSHSGEGSQQVGSAESHDSPCGAGQRKRKWG